jgi:hypothetical protein
MNEIEKEKAESISLLALSLLEIVIKQEFNDSWSERFENLFNSSQAKVIQMLENYILKAENNKDGITLNFPEGTDNLRLLISEVVKYNFNTFKIKFKNNNNE